MSISSELLTLNNTKTAIRTAINNKGGSVSASDTFASYATAIDNLPSGGSGNPLLTSIDVSDFTGTTFNDVRSYITGVTIPNSVTSINDTVFQNCSSLTSVTIPNSVTSIGKQAFKDCTGLTIIDIPNSVTFIDGSAFNGCSSLTGVTIPNSVTTISGSTFNGCSSLTGVTIPNSVTSIGNSAFNSCSGLTDITIPNTVTSIGSYAFAYCTGLTSIIVLATTPPTLASSNAFNNTNNCPIYVPAESVDAYKAANNWSTYASRIQASPTPTPTPTYYAKFTSTNSSINGQTLTGTNGVITNEEVTTIVWTVQFQRRPTVTAVELTDLVTEISEQAFFAFTGLTSLTIPDTVTTLGNYAFQDCIGLTSVTIGSGITSIGDYAFGLYQESTSALTSVTVKATTPPTIGTGIFDNETTSVSPANSNLVIYVPAASVAAYQAASGWSTYASRIQAIPAE